MVCLLAVPWVQLSVSAGNGWPHNALRHHWLMPIGCHFRDCKALLVTSLTHVSGAITSVQTFTFTRHLSLQEADKFSRPQWLEWRCQWLVRLLNGAYHMILQSLVLRQYHRVTDRWTDRRTDGHTAFALSEHRINKTVLREHKPPPMPKIWQNVILDLNPDCWINPDLDVCVISRKMLWNHYLVGVSHSAKFCKNRAVTAWEMLINLLKSAVPPWWVSLVGQVVTPSLNEISSLLCHRMTDRRTKNDQSHNLCLVGFNNWPTANSTSSQ